MDTKITDIRKTQLEAMKKSNNPLIKKILERVEKKIKEVESATKEK